MKEENLKGQTILRDNYLPGEGLYPAPIGKSCKKSSVQYQANKFKVSERFFLIGTKREIL